MKKIGFMFAGQGAQFVGMGKDLAETSVAAKNIFDLADKYAGRSISNICFNGPIEDLTVSTNCQPAIYTMSVACAAALQEKLNINPIVTGGLSLGEYAALTTAGALSFEVGFHLISERSRLMNDACRNSEGGMSAILRGDIEVIKAICEECGIDVANFNCPGQIVISGDKNKVLEANAKLAEKGCRVIPLTVDGAFHSRLMQPAADSFVDVLKNAKIETPNCPVAQNITGQLENNSENIRANLAKQISGSVLWEQCVNSMIEQGAEILIEFGPGNVLRGFCSKINKSITTYSVNSIEELEKTITALQA